MLNARPLSISKRVSSQIPSPFTEIFELRDQYLRSIDAIELIDASQGVPDYPPPTVVMSEIERASAANESFAYTDRRGIFDLREAICNDFRVNRDFSTYPNEILITSGCNAAFCVAASATVDPGEQAIVPRPYYFNHPMWLEMIGAQVVEAKSTVYGIPDLDQIVDLTTSRTRAVVLVSPSNPTGATIPNQKLEEFTDKLRKCGVYVILDETYRAFSEQDQIPYAGSSFERFPNLIRLLSFSKELAIPGLRVGAICASQQLTQEMLKVHDCFSICTPPISQQATLAGLEKGSKWQFEKTRVIAQKRKRFLELMKNCRAGFEVTSCGGFFAWLKHPFDNTSSWGAVKQILFRGGILTLPGSLFGDNQESYIRVGLAALSFDEIEELVSRLNSMG